MHVVAPWCFKPQSHRIIRFMDRTIGCDYAKVLSSEMDLYDLAVFCGCIIICFREGHHGSTASCLRNLDLGKPDVNNDNIPVSCIFALANDELRWMFSRHGALSHSHTGSYNLWIVRLFAIGRRCDRSSMFATISSNGRLPRWISTHGRAITNYWRISTVHQW